MTNFNILVIPEKFGKPQIDEINAGGDEKKHNEIL